jgi:hypothetical protein
METLWWVQASEKQGRKQKLFLSLSPFRTLKKMSPTPTRQITPRHFPCLGAISILLRVGRPTPLPWAGIAGSKSDASVPPLASHTPFPIHLDPTGPGRRHNRLLHQLLSYLLHTGVFLTPSFARVDLSSTSRHHPCLFYYFFVISKHKHPVKKILRTTVATHTGKIRLVHIILQCCWKYEYLDGYIVCYAFQFCLSSWKSYSSYITLRLGRRSQNNKGQFMNPSF